MKKINTKEVGGEAGQSPVAAMSPTKILHIAKAIDNMTSVCDKGKQEIRDVLIAMGIDLKMEVKPKTGQLWRFLKVL